MKGALLCLGTTSDAGKSTVVTGLCRLLARKGISVAPFKAQNMSLHSFVTAKGQEMGRAQAIQAIAAGVEPDARMNPILLKPGTETRSQIVVLGHPAGELDAHSWHKRYELFDIVVDSYDELRSRFDVVLCEGAGSPAEINLRESDLVNLGFARARNVPSLVVGDINPGGVFAAFMGTLAVLAPQDQDLVFGFIINKFRGERSLLASGLDWLANQSGRPVLGVVPFISHLGIDTEDALDYSTYIDPLPPLGEQMLQIAVVRFPRASNLTDFDALAIEPGIVIRFITRPEEMIGADLVVLPGSRATVADLRWLRERSFPQALAKRAASGQPILGICAGFQMLGVTIDDRIESGVGVVDGLGLLQAETIFEGQKLLAQRQCVLDDDVAVTGYEIHHGRVRIHEGEPMFANDGARSGFTMGTTWHGLFESDSYRRLFLSQLAQMADKQFVVSPSISFSEHRSRRIDLLASLMEEHLDWSMLSRIIEQQGETPPRLRLTLDATSPNRSA